MEQYNSGAAVSSKAAMTEGTMELNGYIKKLRYLTRSEKKQLKNNGPNKRQFRRQDARNRMGKAKRDVALRVYYDAYPGRRATIQNELKHINDASIILTTYKNFKTSQQRVINTPNAIFRTGVDIHIQKSQQALFSALNEHVDIDTTTKPPNRFVLWSDGSARDKYDGYGVAFKKPGGDGQWMGWGSRRIKARDVTSQHVEAFAIVEALNIAYVLLRDMAQEERPSTVRIYTDAQMVLRSLRSQLNGVPEGGAVTSIMNFGILDKVLKLIRIRVHVELCWVPGHEGEPGNALADSIAGKVSLSTQSLGLGSVVSVEEARKRMELSIRLQRR